MKTTTSTKHKTLKLRASRQIPQQGFALIATISVMVLMVMIALAMLSLSTIELRSAKNTKHQQVAQANARMALMLAIGELQKYAGPDTRVTANASLANDKSPNPYWVSVYTTRPDEDLAASPPVSGSFVVDHHDSPLCLTDSRISEGGEYERPSPLTHLVSGHDQYSPDTVIPSSESVLLLDTGNTASSVRVPLVNVNGSRDASRYAYWVSDNSVKALYNKANPYSKDGNLSPSASNEEYYSASISQSPYLDDFEIDGNKPLATHSSLDPQLLEKGITTETSRLLFSDLTDQDLKKSFHSIVSDSAAVFSDPIHGGLKHDLTAFIEAGDMTPSNDDQNKNLPDLLASTPMIKGAHHNMTSPRFGILKNWADMRFKMSSASGEVTIDPQISPDSFRQNFKDSLNLKRRDLTKVQSNYLQPVVVEASLGWDFSPYPSGSGEKLRSHIYPRLTLWNPYNVTLTARKYVLMTKIPMYVWFGYRGETKNVLQLESKLSSRIYYREALGMKQDRKTKQWPFPGFITVSTSLEPGECKVFSPDMTNSKGSSLGGKARKFDSVNINNNVLSPEKAPSSENFYWDSDYSLQIAKTDANQGLPYSWPGKSWGAGPRNADEYIVMQSSSGISGDVTFKDLEEDDKYETISHFLAESYSEKRESKTYKGGVSESGPFKEMTSWSAGRLPPRLWRRGIRLQWFDESAEAAALPKYYTPNSCRLSTPLLATINLHGGVLNHPSPLGARLQDGGNIPNMNGHLYFMQPTGADEFNSFFPPSPIARPVDGYPNRVVLFDLPRKDPGIFSLGQFQSAQFSYLPWHPSYILGSSYSTHQADLDATALRDKQAQLPSDKPFLITDSARWAMTDADWGDKTYQADNLSQRTGSDSVSEKKHGDEVLIYDIAYELNHAFWDRYMLSSIPYKGELNHRTADWDGDEPLPVSHYRPRPTSRLSIPQMVDEVAASPQFTFYHSAEFLLNHGALNVNCDNKEVWKAYLLSLQDKKHPNLTGGPGAGAGPGTSSIVRNLLPGEDGSTSINSSSDGKAWNGFRALTSDEIDSLAGELVKQVRARGPFLSMSDFMNRRLNKTDQQNYAGVMQAAIDDAEINADLEQAGGLFDADKTNEVAKHLPSIKNRVDYKTAMLPGYFSQNDLVTVLAPSLTARGDTFTIRAYGESRDASGVNVLARAYCEAVVQRVPEYLDASDDAIEPVRLYDETNDSWKMNHSSGSGDEGISKANHQFGRKFKIQKFRWLSTTEV